jgi:hypothetical protein
MASVNQVGEEGGATSQEVGAPPHEGATYPQEGHTSIGEKLITQVNYLVIHPKIIHKCHKDLVKLIRGELTQNISPTCFPENNTC